MEGENEIQHVVIGHSQIRHLENYDFSDQPEINFPIEFICVGGGLAPNLIRIIKEKITQATKPMCVSAIIWQNSNWDITVQQVEEIVWDMEQFLKVYPFHRVAFPECQFVPQQERIWDKIARINAVLNSYNLRQGFARYPLHKVTMQYSKQKKSLVVRQTSYREYNNAVRAASEQSRDNTEDKHSNLGYHIDEGAPKRRYAQHIRRFHLNGFNANIPRPRVSSPEPKRSSIISFARNPVNKMKSPKVSDARVVINKIKADKMREEQENPPAPSAINSYHTDISIEDTAANPQLPESSSSNKPEQLLNQTELKEWIQTGRNSGYLSIITKLIKKNEKQKRGKKRYRSESSDSSDSDEEKRRRKVQKRSNKKKSKHVSSSSSAESSSSSSSSESSDDEKEARRS